MRKITKREFKLHSHKFLSYMVGHLNHSSCLLFHKLVDQRRIKSIPDDCRLKSNFELSTMTFIVMPFLLG